MEMETEEGIEWSFWEELKRDLDNNMPPEDLRELIQLVKGQLGQRMKIETDMSSEVLKILENTYSDGHALTILKHVLGAMEYHHEDHEHHNNHGGSYVKLIESYEDKLKSLDRDENFVGRSGDLKEILQMFSPTSNIVGYWIHAIGGMGKTTLVKEVYTRICTRQTMRMIKLDLSSTNRLEDMLTKLLHEIGHYSSETKKDELLLKTFECVTCLEQDTLVVFDGIEYIYKDQTDEVEKFVNNLVGDIGQLNSKVKLLFTSRIPFTSPEKPHSFCLLPLQPLKEKDAERLLRLHLGKPFNNIDMEDIAIVLNISGLIPLHIRQKSNHIRGLCESGICSVRDSLKFMQDTGENDSIEFAFKHLDQNKQKQLAMLMVFEESSFGIEDATIALGEGRGSTHLIVSVFITAQLIQDNQTVNTRGQAERYRSFGFCFHPVVLRILKKIIKGPLEMSLRFAKQRLSMHTLEQMEHECEHFEKQFGNAARYVHNTTKKLEILFSALSDDAIDMRVSDQQLYSYLKRIPPIMSSHSSRYETLKKQSEACLKRGDLRHYWLWRIEIVKNFLELEDDKNANENLQEIENSGLLSSNVENKLDAILISEYLLTKGRILRRFEKNYDGALKAVMKALDTLQVWEDELPLQAAIYNAIGNIRHDREEFDESYDYHKKAVDIMEIYTEDGWTPEMSVYVFNLGTIAHAKAREVKKTNDDRFKELLSLALGHYNRCIKKDVEMRIDNLHGHSKKLKIRANAYRDLKDYDRAIADVQKLTDILEKLLREGPKANLILGYHQMAELYRKRANDLRNKPGDSVSREAGASRKDYLKTSWFWMNKAACTIKEAGENGLSPHGDESRNFAKDYVDVANGVLKNKAKIAAIQFRRDFEAGEYWKSESDGSTSTDGSIESDSNGSDDSDEVHRRDSGIEGSLSSMEPNDFAGRSRSYSLYGRQTSRFDDQNDIVFMEEEQDTFVDTAQQTNSGRKRTASD